MKNFPRILSKKIGRFVPTTKLFLFISPVLLPFYHVVSNKELPHVLNYPYKNEKQFELELNSLIKFFKPVSLEYLVKNKKTKENICHLSFDDGLKECAEIIAPVLIKNGIPATFFINSAFVDNKALFHRYKASLILSELYKNPCFQAEEFLKENGLNRNNILLTNIHQSDILDEAAEIMRIDFFAFLNEQKPYLSTKQVKDLNKQGFTIGSHSHEHPEFWKISEKKQLKQITKSMKWVKENINPKIKAFAFPFTDDQVSKNLISKLTNEKICDITFGTAGLKYDEISSHFQRYPAEQNGNFIENLKAEFVYFKLRKIVGKSTVKH